VSALRVMAEAHRRLGDRQLAWQLTRRCLEVGRGAGGLLGQVAALAAGDALLDDPPADERALLRQAWRDTFPSDHPDAIAAELARWIY